VLPDATTIFERFAVNVTVENQASCRKTVRIEVDAATVDAMFASVTKDFQKQAALPGFRPGKAPLPMVLKKHEQDIAEEVKRKLISDNYRKAMEEQKFDVLGYPDVKDTQFGREQALKFEATFETAPAFELPEYKGLPAKREAATVTEADIEKALGVLRDQRVDYKTVERPLASGDIAVVNYTGTCDGQPITDIAPTAKGLTEQKGFWVPADSSSFIPGFGEQLAGAKAGDKRTVTVNFPADFVTQQLQGKTGVYAVELVEVKEKLMPEVNDEFAKSFGAESLEKLREGVRTDLQNELTYKLDKSVRGQVLQALHDKVSFDLPESIIEQETKNLVYNIVRENQNRGVGREVIEKEKDKIYAAAAQQAKSQVKTSFILRKIAEKEDIKVSNEEVLRRVHALAGAYQTEPKKFLQDLQKRNGLIEIYDQLASEKVVEFLQKNATVEEVPVGSLGPVPA
jgi:trigger factor